MNWFGVIALVTTTLPVVVNAHEFWIEPEAYQVAPGAPMRADLKVGETFGGAVQAYLPRNFERFDLSCSGETQAVAGRAGDRPALTVDAPQDGLCVVVHQTRDYTLTYRDWQKFLNFVEHKDFANAASDHLARGLPQTGFVEQYSRYAKSLIAVGEGRGADAEMGLTTEIVADANPYTDALGDGMPVRVLYNGAPRADVQVELFSKAPDGSVEVTLHRTDEAGRAVLPVQAGHAYLVDAVVLRPVDAAQTGAPVWESLWASLTFAVPE
ncbi:DUF4198 domain-containing protein [Marivita sp. S2033]|uniref:DUF4198 domain-containing protein n=1 Tax=Marivita sp. S2033 TaxID=3373187 RepID=UPI003982C533